MFEEEKIYSLVLHKKAVVITQRLFKHIVKIMPAFIVNGIVIWTKIMLSLERALQHSSKIIYKKI